MSRMNQHASLMAVALALSSLSTTASAGGFGIGTQSGSGTGNAFAGGAAAAEDASVAWSNPAAMSALPSGKQFTAAGHILVPSFKFTNAGSTGAFAAPGTGDGGDGGGVHVVPNMFYTMDINPKLRFGFALNAPFGLATEYEPGWRGQLTGIESEIKTVNLNPSIAYKLGENSSIGVGVSLQKIDAKLTGFAGAPGVLKIEGDDIGFGYNLGYFVKATPSTQIGMTYRSKVAYELEGSAIFSVASAGNGSVRADITMPDSASLSVVSAMGGRVEVMADLTYTGWSKIKRLDIIRTSGPLAGQPVTSLLFNWKDTLRYGVGANYKLDGKTKLRFGLAFDETPTNDIDRTPRLPDQDRTWVAFGVQYKPNNQGTLEVGYAHEFVKDATVSATPNPAVGRLNGTFNNKADILSVQYSHRF